MKYVIIGIYDSGYEFTVCDNGRTLFKEVDELADEVYAKYLDNYPEKLFCDWLKDQYSDYDLIAICEDGETKILVDSSYSENVPKKLAKAKSAKVIQSVDWHCRYNCPNCNEEIKVLGAYYCPLCGTKLSWD